MTDSEAKYRLPRSVTPSRYELRIEPDLADGAFSGVEDVAVTIHEAVTEIVLNARALQVTGASLRAGTLADPRQKIPSFAGGDESNHVTWEPITKPPPRPSDSRT